MQAINDVASVDVDEQSVVVEDSDLVASHTFIDLSGIHTFYVDSCIFLHIQCEFGLMDCCCNSSHHKCDSF